MLSMMWMRNSIAIVLVLGVSRFVSAQDLKRPYPNITYPNYAFPDLAIVSFNDTVTVSWDPLPSNITSTILTVNCWDRDTTCTFHQSIIAS